MQLTYKWKTFWLIIFGTISIVNACEYLEFYSIFNYSNPKYAFPMTFFFAFLAIRAGPTIEEVKTKREKLNVAYIKKKREEREAAEQNMSEDE